MSRTHKLKRLYKFGLIARVESSGDEESLGEDASKQGRINAIDADEEITLVRQNENVVEEVVDAAQVSTGATTVTITTEEITLAQALEALKTSKPKDDIHAKIDVDYQLAERLQAQEQEELSIEEKSILFQQLLEKRRKHFAAKRAEDKRNKPPTKAQQKKIITELVEGKEKRARTELVQESIKKQKMEDDKETAEIKKLMKIILDEEVAIDAIPLAVKSSSIIDWKIHKEGRKNYYQIIRADGKSQIYMIFSHMLKSFDREDLETLYKLVKAKYESTSPVEDLDLLL
ncbi:hypothetical protein Tco_0054498 [Tanacetum coccineum]